ncbi:uncharacterized protein IAS62_000581 [Cryptococcus decagattii]|uniref:SUN domain-containing protein n=1 Tax=Cryptococcus decagattii TaxID=1859122 RepID=A0ABZ2ALU1_9TREE
MHPPTVQPASTPPPPSPNTPPPSSTNHRPSRLPSGSSLAASSAKCRGPQTFTLPQPTAFHRFIRLDFSSYYGSEYYCPVSSLKVYGMNQMEAFKWEQKQLNHNREKEMLHNREKEMLHQEEDVRRAKETQERDRKERERDERDKQQQREKELDELEKLLHEQAGRLVPSKLLTDSPFSTDPPPAPSTTFISKHGDDEKREDSSIPTNDSLAAATSSESSTTPSSPYTRAVPRSDSSESIYAFIIRRLDALEGNSSLVARYMEEQAKVMRSMLERVKIGWDEWKGEWEDEDRARWQQERMRQEDRLGRVISQLEQQRIAFDAERKSIETRLCVLADQLGYERRRGIAQLIIMLILILLGAASRSRTINAILTPLVTEARRQRQRQRDRKNTSPRHVQSSTFTPTPTPRLKTSLSRIGSGTTRKAAAQTAHLHTMETGDRVPPIHQDVGTTPKKTAAAAPPVPPPKITSLVVDLENGGNVKRRRRLRSVLKSGDPTRRKDAYHEGGGEAMAGDTSQASASHVEDQVRDDTDTKEEMDGDTEQHVQENGNFTYI